MSDWDDLGNTNRDENGETPGSDPATIRVDEDIHLPINVGTAWENNAKSNVYVPSSAGNLCSITLSGLTASTTYNVAVTPAGEASTNTGASFTTGADETSKTINVTVTNANQTIKDRTLTMTVTSASNSEVMTFNIVQVAGGLTLDPASATIESNVTSTSFTVKNAAGTGVNLNSNSFTLKATKNGVEFTPTYTKTDAGVITVTGLEENTGDTKNVYVFTVSDLGDAKDVSTEVTQYAALTLTFETATFNNNSEQTAKLQVKNTSGIVSPSTLDGYITVTAAGSGDSSAWTYDYSHTNNTWITIPIGTVADTYTITIINADGAKGTATLTITED